MAAPSASIRGTPAGIRLRDGFSTKIAFKRNLTISFWEKSVKPPGLDGGDAIETSTMHNITWRTMTPRSLVTMKEAKVTAAYDPNLYNNILALLNINDEITVKFPDGSTLAFWGFLKDFDPAELVEGTMPLADITIVPTNQDNAGVEQPPVLTSVAGT